MVEIETESENTFWKDICRQLELHIIVSEFIKFVILILKNDTVVWDIPDECNASSTCLDANVITNVT